MIKLDLMYKKIFFGLTSKAYIVLLLNLQSELPLVGNKAPDFEAEAVFDQEFIKVDDITLFFMLCNLQYNLCLCNVFSFI